ncbi:hypothetical protein ACP70R_021534 [Stipagrostis hirtigluma subsp. patula]
MKTSTTMMTSYRSQDIPAKPIAMSSTDAPPATD